MILILITPLLGIIKNYIKYKNINIYLIFRTPIICCLIKYLFKIDNIFKILIYERWYMFLVKIIKSYINDDYNKKKNKYMKKYNIKYN